jgi:hypothetical protein
VGRAERKSNLDPPADAGGWWLMAAGGGGWWLMAATLAAVRSTWLVRPALSVPTCEPVCPCRRQMLQKRRIASPRADR